MFIDKKYEKFEYSITGNDVVPQNMIGDIFWGTPCISSQAYNIRTLAFDYCFCTCIWPMLLSIISNNIRQCLVLKILVAVFHHKHLYTLRNMHGQKWSPTWLPSMRILPQNKNSKWRLLI
jgi:hypothetical protein